MKKIDLILHPLRFRILQAINSGVLTTQEIANELPDIPQSSIYRQLKILLDGEMVAVAETRLVNGIQEKTYRLAQRPYLGPGDIVNLSGEEHVQYFSIYMMSVLREFADYVQRSEAADGVLDFLADRVGYTEAAVYVTNAEFDVLQADINAALMKVIENGAGNGRHRHKLAIITHPVRDAPATKDE